MLSDWTLERAGRGKRGENGVLSPECDLLDLEARASRAQQPRSAALVIIGDEILKGKCSDTNAPFAARELRAAGVPLQRIVTVADDLESISAEVRRCMQSFDLVVTSGGLGPTHDDVTIRALADALGQRLQRNEEMWAHLQRVHGAEDGGEVPEEAAKLAELPELSKLLWPPLREGETKQKWPILQCDNVFVLPGVPQFFEDKLADIVQHFVEPRRLSACKVVLGVDEGSVVSALNALVEANPRVTFGSYPFVGALHPKTIITLEAEQDADVEAALGSLMAALPAGAVLRVEQDDSLA